jgi:transcriptional regulator with XRE-family HTH domain
MVLRTNARVPSAKSSRPELMALAQRIVRLRQARGFTTQASFADACGVDTNQIQRLESGKRNPRFLTLVDVARGLNIDVAALVSDAYPPDAPLVRARADTDWTRLQEAAREWLQVCTDMAAYEEGVKQPATTRTSAPAPGKRRRSRR